MKILNLFWRKKFLFLGIFLGLSAGLLLLLSIVYSFRFFRMWDDEALNTFQVSLPVMPRGTIPVGGGIALLRNAGPKQLINPLPISPAVIERGRISYKYYCIHCHGTGFDGQATVGQSFYPLPTYLLGPKVMDQSDGELFYKISLGYKREPPLYDTVAVHDRWAVINYLRTLAKRSSR